MIKHNGRCHVKGINPFPFIFTDASYRWVSHIFHFNLSRQSRFLEITTHRDRQKIRICSLMVESYKFGFECIFIYKICYGGYTNLKFRKILWLKLALILGFDFLWTENAKFDSSLRSTNYGISCFSVDYDVRRAKLHSNAKIRLIQSCDLYLLRFSV